MRHRSVRYYGFFVIFMLFLAGTGAAWALGDVGRRDLTGRVDLDIFPLYDGPRAVPSGQGAPDDDALLVRLLDLLEDMDEPDDGDRALLDPDYFLGLFLTEPDFRIRLDEERGNGLERVLAVVYLYDRRDERWVFFSRHVGGWRDDRLSFAVEVVDGGRYDQGESGDGKVEVAMALGVGVVEDDDGLGIILGFGGCRLTGWPFWVFCLFPLAGTAIFGKGA